MCGGSDSERLQQKSMLNWLAVKSLSWINSVYLKSCRGSLKMYFQYNFLNLFPEYIFLFYIYVAQYAFIIWNLLKQARKAEVY